ncbi:SH3 domain-containing protein [Streptomyces sp. NPDC050264]|uniref:SH3 domain-containing protein n=1 Tax=Streptomyces sp. NPDC050264 TaxID=3155038 RepID=UPI0034363F6C
MRRTTPALTAAALLTGGILAVSAAAPASADHGKDVVWGTVVSRSDLNLRASPSMSSAVVDRLAPGSQDRLQCAAHGSSVNGTSTWFWFTGAHGWASASYVDTNGRGVPDCSTPHKQQHQQKRDGGSPSGYWFRSDYRVEFGVTN